MRVLITGMGGELGTRVALLLEQTSEVDEIVGIDVDPPRRRLRRATFHRVDPRDRHRTVEIVTTTAPTAVVHLGVYEPDARSTPDAARERTSTGTIAALGAAVDAGRLDRIVLRSGIEVYGRGRGTPTVPDEDVPPDPTTNFGHSLLRAEAIGASAGDAAGVPVAALRMAPIVGPHFPSPLGRFLRLPVVPVSLLADPPFSLLHQEDAAAAVVAALLRPHDGPLNVVGRGAVTALQAALMGRRVPFPLVGPEWRIARRVAELMGSPVPHHVLELMHRGRTADSTRSRQVLGVEPEYSTPDIVKELYEWAPVTHLRTVQGEAA